MLKALLGGMLIALPASLAAQSSQFGVNGLGLPGREISVRSQGSAGALALFDAGSTLNPASIADYPRLTATFSLLQTYRASSNSREEVSGRDTRFPLFAVAGPVPRSRLSLGASFSNFTDRDFAVATDDTLLLRGNDVVVHDTLTSRGGLSDLRFAGAWRARRWVAGAGLHVTTGSARVAFRRVFEDSSFANVSQRAELSYSGLGVSLGATGFITPQLTAAAFVRVDGDVRIDRDSSTAGEVPLPLTLGSSVNWRPSGRLDLSAMAVFRRWSSADEAIRNLGGTGADNTAEFAVGGEWLQNTRRPGALPVRFGVHRRTLPFPVQAGSRPSETGVSVGSGLALARDMQTGLPRAQVDLSVSHLWRSADGGYDESAWGIGVGVSVRP